MLRLQRGEPVVYLSAQDAAAREIEDHDRVRLRNDLGAFELRAKIAATVQPGQVLIYHAWEPFQFRGGRSEHAVVPSPIKPTSLPVLAGWGAPAASGPCPNRRVAGRGAGPCPEGPPGRPS